MKRQIDDVMGLCCKISDSRQIKAAVQNSAKGAATAGGGAFLGGLLGGPPGIFIGMYWLVCLISCHPQTLTYCSSQPQSGRLYYKVVGCTIYKHLCMVIWCQR